MTVSPCASRVRSVLRLVAKSKAVALGDYPPFSGCEACSPNAAVPYCVAHPFHAAIMMEELALLKKAVAEKTPEWLSEYDSRGYTVLHCAVDKGNEKVISWLLSIGANSNAVTRASSAAPVEWSVTPLYQATFVHKPNRAKLIELLLEHGANPNDPAARDPRNGATCLHNAAFFGEHNAVRALLRHGADPDALDFNGDTAAVHAHRGIQFASSPNGDMSFWPGAGLFRHGHGKIIRLLKEHGR